jgi:hypothetical protein
MDDTNLTFNDDDSALGGAIYFNREAYSTHTDLMNHTEEVAFDKHLDDLIDKHKYEELARYSFISFVKPADYDRKKYSVEPLGPEREEWTSYNYEIKIQSAADDAERHFYLMWLCVHPEEVEQLQAEILLSTEDLGRLRGISDLYWVEERRKYAASTIRQVERMKRKYTVAEIEAANASIDEMNREFAETTASIDEMDTSQLSDLD